MVTFNAVARYIRGDKTCRRSKEEFNVASGILETDVIIKFFNIVIYRFLVILKIGTDKTGAIRGRIDRFRKIVCIINISRYILYRRHFMLYVNTRSD